MGVFYTTYFVSLDTVSKMNYLISTLILHHVHIYNGIFEIPRSRLLKAGFGRWLLPTHIVATYLAFFKFLTVDVYEIEHISINISTHIHMAKFIERMKMTDIDFSRMGSPRIKSGW